MLFLFESRMHLYLNFEHVFSKRRIKNYIVQKSKKKYFSVIFFKLCRSFYTVRQYILTIRQNRRYETHR